MPCAPPRKNPESWGKRKGREHPTSSRHDVKAMRGRGFFTKSSFRLVTRRLRHFNPNSDWNHQGCFRRDAENHTPEACAPGNAATFWFLFCSSGFIDLRHSFSTLARGERLDRLHLLIAFAAACWKSRRTLLASLLGKFERCTISTYATPLTGSIHACVPHAPPWP